MNLKPIELPEIDSVEIVNLKRIDASSVSEFMQNASDAPYVRVQDELAQKIANLWRQLPQGEQSRCHIPPFGLRFYNKGNLQLQASICWECDNVFGEINGRRFWFAFDAQNEQSQELLSLCKHVFD